MTSGSSTSGRERATRVATHGRQAGLEPEPGEKLKTARIRAIRRAGLEPQIDIVRHGLEESTAFLVEAALIDCLPSLTNHVAGHGVAAARTAIEDLISTYGAAALDDTSAPPALFIRLSTRWMPLGEEIEPGYYRDGSGWAPHLSPTRLYDSTRAWWKVSPRAAARRGVEVAVAIVAGVSRAVYKIDGWIGPRPDGRHAFYGPALSDGAIFDAYVGPLGKRVPFAAHSQNPTHYWPPQRVVGGPLDTQRASAE